MQQNVVCIDFGNSYTKVGVRPDYTGTSYLARGLSISQEDEELGQGFCIPTVVAQRDVPGRPVAHAFGEAAAAIVPAPNVAVYRNWKPKLLATPTERTPQGDTWRDVATRFFAALRQELVAVAPDTRHLPARVCIPLVSLADAKAQKRLMMEVLASAGWPVASQTSVIHEPVANTWGVVTEGYNHTWIPDRGPQVRCINLHEMLRNRRLFNSLRNATLQRHLADFQYTVLVIDIGAYTTDCGLVVLDGGIVEDDYPCPGVIHQSFEMGIKELDQEIYANSSEEAKLGIENMSTREWESLKRRLYGGNDVAVRIDGSVGKTIRIDARPVSGCIAGFTERVLQCCDRFLAAHHPSARVNDVVLTGGGMRVSQVSDVMIDAVRTGRIKAAHILPADTNHELARGASALGGASVICG
jgi:hypothetical protein